VNINNLVFAFGGITILIASGHSANSSHFCYWSLLNVRNNYNGDESYVLLIKPVVDVSKSHEFFLCHVCVCVCVCVCRVYSLGNNGLKFDIFNLLSRFSMTTYHIGMKSLR